MSDVTQVLSAIEQGDPKAAEQLLPLVYEELRKLAVQRLAAEKPGQTLQPRGPASTQHGAQAGALFFLAMADWQMGARAAAQQQYDRAVKLMDKGHAQEQNLHREAEALLKHP